MGHSVDLLTLVEIYNTSIDLYERFCGNKNISIKAQEIDCIHSMLDNFDDRYFLNRLNNYSVGFKIDQIGKEFDLLKIDEFMVINIELKSELNLDSILDQCRRNNYYLQFLNREIVIITYELTSNNFYLYNNKTDKLSNLSLEDFKIKINSQNGLVQKPNTVFLPSNYLVSPFNSTKSFLNNEYFLTNHQEDIIRTITTKTGKKFTIEGGAGTGKTLLVYHLAKIYLESGFDVRIVHAGSLNEGHRELIDNSFNIFPVKDYKSSLSELSDNSVIIIDEAQRLNDKQMDEIFLNVNKSNSYVFFSFDKMQVLSKGEEDCNITDKIKNKVDSKYQFKLTTKIRTNKLLSDFVLCLIDNNKTPNYSNYLEVSDFSFVSSFDLGKSVAEKLIRTGWQVINPSSSLYNTELHHKYTLSISPSAHQVIGQEFDKVAIIIPPSYYYNNKGQLVFQGKSYYKAEKMFYQAISRTRLKLHLIIVDNPIILNRLLDLKM